MKIMQSLSISKMTEHLLKEIQSGDENKVITEKSLTDQWLIRQTINPNAKIRLFCFPNSGTGASLFSGWSEYLHIDIEIYAIQKPGKEDRIHEKPITDDNQYLKEITNAMLPLLIDHLLCLGIVWVDMKYPI